jgi:dihydropyrimidinase
MGVISFKAFMAYSKRGMLLGDDELMKIMELIVKNRAILAAHAENGSILDYLEDKFTAEGNLSPEFYSLSHPNSAEAEAIFRILTLAQVVGCPMYLPHVSAGESLEVLRLFRRRGGPPFFAETCPHYLTLTEDEMSRRGSLAKVAPPLRKSKDVEQMWAALQEGQIDVIGSDTAGHAVKAKEPLWDEVFKAPYGIPGVDTVFTVTYDEGVNRGRIILPRLVEVMCENPAKIFDIYPKKGILQEGSDADVVIFDPSAAHTIGQRNEHLNVDYSMYEGRQCLGAPILVMQRGEVLMEDGKLKAAPGQGRFTPGRQH